MPGKEASSAGLSDYAWPPGVHQIASDLTRIGSSFLHPTMHGLGGLLAAAAQRFYLTMCCSPKIIEVPLFYLCTCVDTAVARQKGHPIIFL
jgi:hypothetical protein